MAALVKEVSPTRKNIQLIKTDSSLGWDLLAKFKLINIIVQLMSGLVVDWKYAI